MTNDSERTKSKDYDPNKRPSNPVEAVTRSQKKFGAKTGHVTGRYGIDVNTNLPVADPSPQPIQSASDRIKSERKEVEDAT